MVTVKKLKAINSFEEYAKFRENEKKLETPQNYSLFKDYIHPVLDKLGGVFEDYEVDLMAASTATGFCLRLQNTSEKLEDSRFIKSYFRIRVDFNLGNRINGELYLAKTKSHTRFTNQDSIDKMLETANKMVEAIG